MYMSCEDEKQYKQEAYFLIRHFSDKTQKKAVKAINDLFSDDEPHSFTWRYVATALKKKSKDNYETYGFGIWFNKCFIGNVYEAIKREDEADEIDVVDYFFKS